MNTLELTLLIWVGGLLAGFPGALTGLGGGVVITPLLTLAFGIDIRYAIGATLVSVIATSSRAAADPQLTISNQQSTIGNRQSLRGGVH